MRVVATLRFASVSMPMLKGKGRARRFGIDPPAVVEQLRGTLRQRSCEELPAEARDDVHRVGGAEVEELKRHEQRPDEVVELDGGSVDLDDLVVLHCQRVHVVVVGDDPGADLLVLCLGHLPHGGRTRDLTDVECCSSPSINPLVHLGHHRSRTN